MDITLGTPRSRGNASKVVIKESRRIFPNTGRNEDAVIVVFSVDGESVSCRVARQPGQRQAKDRDGNDIMIDNPDLVERITASGRLNKESFEQDGAMDAFMGKLAESGDPDALTKEAAILVGMIPAELNPTV